MYVLVLSLVLKRKSRVRKEWQKRLEGKQSENLANIPWWHLFSVLLVFMLWIRLLWWQQNHKRICYDGMYFSIYGYILVVYTRDFEDITQQNIYIVQSRSLFVYDCQQNLVILTHGAITAPKSHRFKFTCPPTNSDWGVVRPPPPPLHPRFLNFSRGGGGGANVYSAMHP